MKDLEVTLNSFDEYIKNRCLSGLADTCAYFVKLNKDNLMKARDELTEAYNRVHDIGDTSSHPNETTQVNLDNLTSNCERHQERADEWQSALDSLIAIGIQPTQGARKSKAKPEDFLIK